MAQTVEQLKASLKVIAERRAQTEQEISIRSARLEAAGVGMKGSLVDKEGFPRADVDIPAIRADRQQVIALSNDHKALSNKMEQLLHELHDQTRQPGVTPAHPSSAAASAFPMDVLSTGPQLPQALQQQQPQQQQQALPRPFAVVDELSPGSPASLAGIQLGDQLARFGDVTADAPSTLQQVAATLQTHEGREVEAVFLRHGAPITLRLVPRQWSGRGLLGCHLRPL